MTTALFTVGALVVLASALAAVLARDLVRAVLAFGVTLAGVALLYGILEAPYLAAIQLLLYVGGVVTVLVFGVMLTRHPGADRVTVDRGRSWPAAVAALAFAAPVAVAILGARAPEPRATAETTASVGTSFVTEHLIAFEVLSVVLLAAMVGAIILARREERTP